MARRLLSSSSFLVLAQGAGLPGALPQGKL
jgi:hypothetical protein